MPRRHPLAAAFIATVLLCTVLANQAAAADGPKLVEMYTKAVTLHKHGEPKAALKIYEKILSDKSMRSQLAPTAAATLYNNAGGIHHQHGDAEAAHAHFAAAVALSPDHAEALVNLALVLSEDEKEHDEALKHARKAVALRPEHPKSHHLLGNILQRLGQGPEAHLRFKTAEALAAGQLASAPRGLFQWRAKKVGERQPAGKVGLEGLEVETVSVVPPVFRIKGFLNAVERKRVIKLATPLMEESLTVADRYSNADTSTGGGGAKKETGKADATDATANATHRPPRVSQTAWLVAHGGAVQAASS
jgi:tetratricopeptide (TPR) repeat protein